MSSQSFSNVQYWVDVDFIWYSVFWYTVSRNNVELPLWTKTILSNHPHFHSHFQVICDCRADNFGTTGNCNEGMDTASYSQETFFNSRGRTCNPVLFFFCWLCCLISEPSRPDVWQVETVLGRYANTLKRLAVVFVIRLMGSLSWIL